jgi:hypothetical protein
MLHLCVLLKDLQEPHTQVQAACTPLRMLVASYAYSHALSTALAHTTHAPDTREVLLHVLYT